MAPTPHVRTSCLLALLLALPGALAAAGPAPAEDAPFPAQAQAALTAGPAGLRAADAVAASQRFQEARSVADHVAAAASAAGHEVEAVSLPDAADPIELLVQVASSARALQVEALRGMTPERWAAVAAGADAAVRALEPRTPGPGDDPAALESYLRERPELFPEAAAGLAALEVDHDRMWQAAFLVASGVDRAKEMLVAEGATLPAAGTFQTSLGPVIVGSAACTNDVYTGLVFLIIEPCGDDQYLSGAGGAFGTGGVPIAIVLDLAGDDATQEGAGAFTPTSPGYAGAIFGGIALALDVAGNDRHGIGSGGYYAGGGWGAGIGVLVEAGGDDTYATGGFLQPAKQGGGFFAGAGVLVDLSGTDRYSGDTYEQGSGWYLGLGVLVELGGDDSYFDVSTFAQGSGGTLGLGLLLDVAGNDAYFTHSPYEQGAGGCGGVGVLIDVFGNDNYQSPGWSQGYGDFALLCTGEAGELPGLTGPSAGLLLDVCGWDAYTLTFGPGQGSASLSLGLLIDLHAQDAYTAPVPGVNDAIRPDGVVGFAIDFDLGLFLCETQFRCPPPTTGVFPDCHIDWCPPPSIGVWPWICVVVECPPPTTGTFPDCYILECPPPSVGVWPYCVTVDPECPPPTTGTFPRCRVETCPPPSIGVYPNCIDVWVECPPPTQGTWPDCYIETCPPPSIGVYPDCIDVWVECPPGTTGQWPRCEIDLCTVSPPLCGVCIGCVNVCEWVTASICDAIVLPECPPLATIDCNLPQGAALLPVPVKPDAPGDFVDA